MAAEIVSPLASSCDESEKTVPESVSRTKDVKCWTDGEVNKWLCSIGYEEEAALFSNEKITGEALVAIEKSDLKELGVQPMGRRIALIAKISELFNTPKQDKHPDVVKKSENITVMKKKITVEDKKVWDAKSKTAYLEKTSLIVREAGKVWPGNKKVHFKNSQTEALKLEELVSRLEQTCQISQIGFGRECIRQHIIQWAHEKNRRLSDGYDYEAECIPAKRAKKTKDVDTGSTNSEEELDLGPSQESSIKESAELEDITTQSSVIVMLCYFDTGSMRNIVVTKQLYPLAKGLNVKYRSLGKYEICVPLAKALILQGFVEVKAEPGQQINYRCLKRSNIVVVKKMIIVKHQLKHDSFSNEVGAKEEEEDGDEGDTDSVSTGSSSVCNYNENRFTKCTDCTRYKEAKEKTHDKKARKEIDKLLADHMDLVWRERRVYYLHRYKARRYPNKYLTIIDDAMDQKTTCIPRVRRKTKATCNLATVGTHLVGAIFHNGQSPNGKEVFGSFDYYQWPHDPNLTGSVLLNMLSRWCERYQLPPVLYLQLDNCVKENKNQYVLWLLALLVELEIFEKIRLNFLPVGHTHEDIDAFFGVYSKSLAQIDVYTVKDLLEAMESCLQIIKAFPFLLDMVFDIKAWLAPFAEELHAHTQPKCFKFVQNEQGKCVMYYRNYSHMQWEGPQQLLKTVPTGKPGLVQPTLHKIDAAALKRDLKKFEENYPERVSRVWAQWLQDLDKLLELPIDWVWPLEVLEKCPKVRPSNEDVAVPTTLQAMRDRETEATQQIYTGRYRPPPERENPVLTSDNFLDTIEVGSFVAVNLSNCDKIPVIGKVIQINTDSVKIHYWKGSFKGKFSPQNLPRSRTPWVDELPKSCILLCSFSLTDGGKLLPSTRKHLQSEYAKLKAKE